MKLEWRSPFVQADWAPMNATSMDEAGRELQAKMPYVEDGAQVRDVDTGNIYKWSPPEAPSINFGP